MSQVKEARVCRSRPAVPRGWSRGTQRGYAAGAGQEIGSAGGYAGFGLSPEDSCNRMI